ncbi:MAG: bifunctional polysaccharide deacetylase/glycosyltransferase family 2 protein [Desulfurococcales archaeon]|nr:bifunctional polysaccharide deacetylase/glycosyltransferase family 2 protein [Desulfurococcales archaeon]
MVATTRWTRAVLALAILLLVTVQPVYTLAFGGAEFSIGRSYVIVEKARYYGGADAAFIFRVDDYVVDPAYYDIIPDDLARPTRFFINYQEQLVDHVTREYPWLRVTLGVITSCHSASCQNGWDRLRELVYLYGWEAASHTRHHTRPPRSPGDLLGSIHDIESNLTGYRVLTYIEPFGKASKGEVQELAEHGVRVVMDSIPGLPMPMDVDDVPVRMHFTVKASATIPWRSLLDTALGEALTSGGVVVFYTHATSYDWPRSSMLTDAVDYAASRLEGRRVWVTTPGELYSYEKLYHDTQLSYNVDDHKLVISVEGPRHSDTWRMPLTLLIYTGHHNVTSVEADGRPLKRLQARWPVSRPVEGYTIGDGFITVSIMPPARIVVEFEGSDPTVLPGSIIGADRLLARARLASVILWVPVAARAVLAFKEAGQTRLRRREARSQGARYIAVVPARNASETIRDVVRSLLRQTVKPQAVVVVDDASTDGTARLVAELATRLGGRPARADSVEGYYIIAYRLGDTMLYIMESTMHRGKAANVNNAVRILQGEQPGFTHVLVVDSDTLLDPRAAERLLSRMESEPRAAAASGLLLLWKPDHRGRLAQAIAGAFRNLGGTLLTLGLRRIESLSGGLGGVSGALMMLRAEVFTRYGGLPENTLAEDTVLVWRLQLHGHRTVLAGDAIAYTVDPGSLRGIARKAMRISAGLVEGGLRLLPEALARGRLMLAATIAYNTLGGLPLALALAHIVATAALIAVGAYAATTAFKLAALLPYAPLAATIILRDPLAYTAAVYVISMLEAALMAAVLALTSDGTVRARILRSLKYLPVFPLVVWTGVIAVLAGIPYAAYRILTGRSQAKW